jgi:hypothetical protein
MRHSTAPPSTTMPSTRSGSAAAERPASSGPTIHSVTGSSTATAIAASTSVSRLAASACQRNQVATSARPIAATIRLLGCNNAHSASLIRLPRRAARVC